MDIQVDFRMKSMSIPEGFLGGFQVEFFAKFSTWGFSGTLMMVVLHVSLKSLSYPEGVFKDRKWVIQLQVSRSRNPTPSDTVGEKEKDV